VDLDSDETCAAEVRQSTQSRSSAAFAPTPSRTPWSRLPTAAGA
jgi:hypothetical protein